jgi:hypothetical protein
MIIADVIANPAEMLLIQRDNVVEDLSATAADPSLRGSVLPWSLDAKFNTSTPSDKSDPTRHAG